MKTANSVSVPDIVYSTVADSLAKDLSEIEGSLLLQAELGANHCDIRDIQYKISVAFGLNPRNKSSIDALLYSDRTVDGLVEHFNARLQADLHHEIS